MTTATAVRTWTEVLTRAQVNHFGSLLGAELRALYVRTNLISEGKAQELRNDLCAYMLRGYATGVSLQLVDSAGRVRFELRYDIRQWDGYSADQLGRGYRRPDVRGLAHRVRVHTTERFQALEDSERRAFYSDLEGDWGPAEACRYASGGTRRSGDRTHVHSRAQLSRSVFDAS